MAKIDDMKITVDVMGLDDLADLLEKIRLRLDSHNQRITRLDARITALEHPAHPDDVRDALAELDAMTCGEPTRLPGLWKLDNFPPAEDDDQ